MSAMWLSSRSVAHVFSTLRTILRWGVKMGLLVRNAADAIDPARCLRRGELLALRWSGVNLDAQRLSVRRSLETVEGVTRTKPPKVARSARTIALSPLVVDVLSREHSGQEELHRAFGTKRADDDWIFTRADGSPWEPGAFSLAFARFVKRAKLPHIRFHDLRHSFGTLALASGVDLQTVSRALGHESTAITSRIYLQRNRSATGRRRRTH